MLELVVCMEYWFVTLIFDQIFDLNKLLFKFKKWKVKSSFLMIETALLLIIFKTSYDITFCIAIIIR